MRLPRPRNASVTQNGGKRKPGERDVPILNSVHPGRKPALKDGLKSKDGNASLRLRGPLAATLSANGSRDLYGALPACRFCTISSERFTCWSGVSLSALDDKVATTLPAWSSTNVVRGKKPWVTGLFCTSITPFCGGIIVRSYCAAILPSGSEATGNLPAQ